MYSFSNEVDVNFAAYDLEVSGIQFKICEEQSWHISIESQIQS